VTPSKAFRFSTIDGQVGPAFHVEQSSHEGNRLGSGDPFLVGYSAFSLLFDNNPHPMWIHDLTTLRFLAVNDAAIRNYMYSGEEFSRMCVQQIHLPEDKRLVQQHVGDSSFPSGAPFIWRHVKRDGTVFDAEISSHDLVFSGRKARLVLATDVTARERACNALRETEERFRDLFDHSNDIVFTTDLDGNFTSLNRASEAITGYSLEEALKGNVSRLLGPECLELARGLRQKKMTEAGNNNYEVEIVRKDGQREILAVRTSVICKDGKATGIFGIAQDITARKHLEDLLCQSRKLESFGHLAGGAVHDFNSLLGVIVKFSEILADRLKSDESLHGFADETLKAGRQAESLTRKLLAFSRHQERQPKVLEAKGSLTDIEQILRPLIQQDSELAANSTYEAPRMKVHPGRAGGVI
jgi:PAS domain S-box-containing protein